MRNTAQSPVEQAARSDAVALPTRHIAEIARALTLMGGTTIGMSSRLPVTPSDKAAIRSFLPRLAARHGLRATFEDEGCCVTVTFERATA